MCTLTNDNRALWIRLSSDVTKEGGGGGGELGVMTATDRQVPVRTFTPVAACVRSGCVAVQRCVVTLMQYQ